MCHLCISQNRGGRGWWGWGGDSQIHGNTTSIFHFPAAVFITFSPRCRSTFCRVAHPAWLLHSSSKGGTVGRGGRMEAFTSWVLFYIWDEGGVLDAPGRFVLEGDRMLIPGETAQPSVPIWVLLLVHDGKEKHPSLPSLSPAKSTLTWIPIHMNNIE